MANNSLMTATDPLLVSLAVRERYRDEYWRKHDPIVDDRLLWRAQTFRHTVHLLPGQTILELGCGYGQLTRSLLRVSREENPITAITFQQELPAPVSSMVETLRLQSLPGPLAGRAFDCVIAMDLLDRNTSSQLLALVYDFLKPGGEMVFYESNPWNPIHKLRSLGRRAVGKRDPRSLMIRSKLYEQLSEIGFVRIYAVFNDFVFAPLTRELIWLLRNLSILLENAPIFRRMAGSILVHAQKPPPAKPLPSVSLCVYRTLNNAVSFVIPCHNEDMNVAPLVTRILELYGDYVREIILVNDGSTDRTAEVIGELSARDRRVKCLTRTPPNGVGLAIRDGLVAATGKYIFTLDCDFQHLLPEFRDLFDGIAEGYDVVIGSRFSRHSVLLGYPFLKILANRAFHGLTVLLFARRIRDATNNLKIMRREVARNLLLRQPGFAVNAETGLQPILLGYKVKQVPISWIGRSSEMGASSFRLVRAGGGYGSVLLGLWLKQYLRTGPYRALRRGHNSIVGEDEAEATDQVVAQ